MVCVSEKIAVRVPSKPDMTSGNKHFRISIVSPRPKALNIPIAAILGRCASIDNEAEDH